MSPFLAVLPQPLGGVPCGSKPESEMLKQISFAFCSPAKSVQLCVFVFPGKPISWQKVKVLTSLGKMHQRNGRLVGAGGLRRSSSP